MERSSFGETDQINDYSINKKPSNYIDGFFCCIKFEINLTI